MKIALIQPNSPFLIDEKVFPNIGLTRVATQLQHNKHQVRILDFAGRDPEEMKDYSNKFDLFGFSSTTPQFPYAMNLFNILKENNPDARTVIGGPHASAMYNLKNKNIDDVNIKDLERFDTIYAGEGEGEGIDKMFAPGWQDGGIVKNIDDTLIPIRKFIDLPSYKYDLLGKKTTSVQTQRGCPHKCTFCSGRDIEMYNKVRTHSPGRVIEELDSLHDNYGFDSFMWYDDEINLNMGRLEELCDALSTRDYQHRGFVRSDSITKHPESVKWMKKAGFVKLCTGVESGSDKILELINKKTTSEMNSDARRIIGEQRIHYESFLLMGHPDETLDDINKTMDWLRINKPDDFDINLITPYPGSKMYDDATPSDKFEGYDWEFKGSFFNKPRYSETDSFYKGIDGKGKSDIRTNTISNDLLSSMRDKIEARYKGVVEK